MSGGRGNRTNQVGLKLGAAFKRRRSEWRYRVAQRLIEEGFSHEDAASDVDEIASVFGVRPNIVMRYFKGWPA